MPTLGRLLAVIAGQACRDFALHPLRGVLEKLLGQVHIRQRAYNQPFRPREALRHIHRSVNVPRREILRPPGGMGGWTSVSLAPGCMPAACCLLPAAFMVRDASVRSDTLVRACDREGCRQHAGAARKPHGHAPFEHVAMSNGILAACQPLAG